MNVVLISSYELGRQPFGLASPAAWLRKAGASVTCFDLAVEDLVRFPVAAADLVAFYVPMHTATKIAAQVLKQVTEINPDAHLCFYGLYAPMNEAYLRGLGAGTILGGEFEDGLVSLAMRLKSEKGDEHVTEPQSEPVISLQRQDFLVPDRSNLPELSNYAHLQMGDGTHRTVGYTEASHGCKHLCRHCPIVPVYGGIFRVVQRDVVLADVENQVIAGAQHITFGDPDFFNGPTHAMNIVEELHRRWPDLTYDVTIKIEHLLKHAEYLPALKETGCLFVTSAVEATDDAILEIFDKNHTRADFIKVASLFREVGLTFNPTFVTFTPWTSPEVYLDLLTVIHDLDLVDNVSPIQYAIRLLIPSGSRLLELPEVAQLVQPFDETALCYPWIHPIPAADQLCSDVLKLVKECQEQEESRHAIFGKVWQLAAEVCGVTRPESGNGASLRDGPAKVPVPYLSEPWYC